jgi:hypothetical protein
VRAAAALDLAGMHDRQSLPAILRLLDPPDPDPRNPAEDLGRPRVMDALRIMPAPESATRIHVTLMRQGANAQGTFEGIITLDSFHTDVADSAIRDIQAHWGTSFPVRGAFR